MRRFLISLGALLLLGLAQCASSTGASKRIGDATQVVVAYEQSGKGFRQTIFGEHVVDPRSFYSDDRSDKFAKVATQSQMRALIDGLDECGFFGASANAAEVDSASAIRVSIDGQEWVLSLHARLDVEGRNRFNQTLAWFQNVYNQISAYHTGNDNTDLSREHDRLRREVESRTGRRQERP
ncbi:MAG: hypothetical protein AB7I19_05670 [Planctomycetota bacterium]